MVVLMMMKGLLLQSLLLPSFLARLTVGINSSAGSAGPLIAMKRMAFITVTTTSTMSRLLARGGDGNRRFFITSSGTTALKSVTGTVYTAAQKEDGDDNNTITLCLYTKQDCTLCDKVKDILISIRTTHSHSLEQVDITDPEHTDTWWSKYKYDIPVLHINGQYWCKHRLSIEQAKQGIEEYTAGTFKSPPGEPNAGEMER